MQSDIFISTFVLIFLAELGDKTQLTAAALALRYPLRQVMTGIAAAFMLLNLLAVLVGKVLFILLPIKLVMLVSALLFIYFGYSTMRNSCDVEDGADGGLKASGAVRTSFLMIFMAELGDKSQLVTASQAARHSGGLTGTFSVFAASTLALLLVSFVGIIAGRQLLRFVPLCWIHRTAGLLFFVFGLAVFWRLLTDL